MNVYTSHQKYGEPSFNEKKPGGGNWSQEEHKETSPPAMLRKSWSQLPNAGFPMQCEQQRLWQSVMNYWLVQSFKCHLPLTTEKTGRQVTQQASSLLGFWVLTSMGTSAGEYPKAALLPGTGMPVLDVWGEGRKGKRIHSLWCWEEPQQMETCLLECISANMLKPETGNMNSVPLRREAIKDFPLMGWLVALDYMNFLARGLDLRAA